MEQWRDVIDSLNEGLIVVSPSLELKASNPAAEALIGSPLSSAALGALLAENPWLARGLEDCLQRRLDLTCADSALIVGGRALSVRVGISMLTDQEGQLGGAIVTLHERSRYEMVAGEERPLGLSPSGLAHEIKNPLTGIKGAAELLAQLANAHERAQQYRDIIVGGVDRIEGLVEQVLSATGPQRLRQELVNIHQVLHGALGLAGLNPARGGGIAVEQIFDPSLPAVLGDEAALERVFLNLIRNAVEALGSAGTIRLRTQFEHNYRVRHGRERRQFLRIEVSDSGPGMEPEALAQLFTPFFTTKPNGTGLGLVLSQHIVTLHGGSLSAQRCQEPPLTGMTFKITLPIAATPRD